MRNAHKWLLLRNNIILPSTIITIGSYAFWWCKLLKYINLPNAIESIGYGAFSHTIEYLGKHVFNGCLSLKPIALPNITVISESMFEYCTSLTELPIPSIVTKIGYLSFYHCARLDNVSFHATISTIESMSLAGCLALHTIEIRNRSTRKFLKLLVKHAYRCPSLWLIKCYSHMFVKYNGRFIAILRKSPYQLVSKTCWVSKLCGLNVPNMLSCVYAKEHKTAIPDVCKSAHLPIPPALVR